MLFVTCVDDYLDVNTDPNNATTVSPDLVLPVAMTYTAEIIQGAKRMNTIGNVMMYNWSQADGFSLYTEEFRYKITPSFYQGIFNDSYLRALKQYSVLENLDDGYDYYVAIAKIMQSYHFQLLVDFYGDIPYFEAIQRGVEATPKYDDAQTIYEDLIVELSEAIRIINNASQIAVQPGNDDIMFGGNMDEWKRFANTVKLRILTRQMSMTGRGDYISKEIAVIITEGFGFITDDVGINPGYLLEEGKQNPMWDCLGWTVGGEVTLGNNATCATDYLINFLWSTNDPRIDFIYEEPETGHLGVSQGYLCCFGDCPPIYVPNVVSNIGPGILKSHNMDAIIFSLAESYFNQAEAIQRNFLIGNAKTAYESGIEASFDYLGASGASDYYSQSINIVGWNDSDNPIETIITQKWIALNSITAEQSWFDYNRTGYPNPDELSYSSAGLPVSIYAITNDRPVRLAYPTSEILFNGSNVPDQPDAFTDKIFWGL